ncbi:MAG TPA: hypothetical protein DIS79_05520 [Bacteroidetes bacterium]|nr:hypothetical protein [Bacteroidota bacterium]HRK03503.1 hypothetical protein [Chlorobiota bacterium]
MKADKLLEELTEVARTLGYAVRRETGTFRGGACLLHEQRLIIINRSMPPEAAAVILARGLCRLELGDTFLKPAVREIIERERGWVENHPDVTIEPVAPAKQDAA